MGNGHSVRKRSIAYTWNPVTQKQERKRIPEVPVQHQLLEQVYDASKGHYDGYRPAPNYKTYKKSLYKLPLEHRAYFMRLRPFVPPGYVHVRLFTSIHWVYRRFWSATLEAILPLEPDGGLDLKLVKDIWRLEACIPISPVHWKPVEPGTNDRLSPISVMVLRELYDCITFIEHPDTDALNMRRKLRVEREWEDLIFLILTVFLCALLFVISPSSIPFEPYVQGWNSHIITNVGLWGLLNLKL